MVIVRYGALRDIDRGWIHVGDRTRCGSGSNAVRLRFSGCPLPASLVMQDWHNGVSIVRGQVDLLFMTF